MPAVHAYQLFARGSDPVGFKVIAGVFKEFQWPRGLGSYQNIRAMACRIVGRIHQEFEENAWARRVETLATEDKMRGGLRHLVAFAESEGLPEVWGCSAEVLAERIREAVLAAGPRQKCGDPLPEPGKGFLAWVCGEPDRAEDFNNDGAAFVGLRLHEWFRRELDQHRDCGVAEAVRLRDSLRAFRRRLGGFAGIPDGIHGSLDLACHALGRPSPDTRLALEMVADAAARLGEVWGELRMGEIRQMEAALGASSAGVMSPGTAAESGTASPVPGPDEIVPVEGRSSGPENGWQCCRRLLSRAAISNSSYADTFGDPSFRAMAAFFTQQASLAAARSAAGDRETDDAFDAMLKRGVSRVRPHPLFLYAALREYLPESLTAPENRVNEKFLLSPPHSPADPIDCGNPLAGIRLGV